MNVRLSFKTRKELLASIRVAYQHANIEEKIKILDGLTEATGYKRLVPFMPEFINALEQHGHFSLSQEVRTKLLTISPATVDRLLKLEPQDKRKGICTTRSGSLLKKQIPIRTLSDWNEIIPGFMEGDLVAHCGVPKTE